MCGVICATEACVMAAGAGAIDGADDGALEPGFGLQPLWLRPRGPPTYVQAMVSCPTGAAACGGTPG
eukprot:CAMPEP_0195150548 /NCGR_PEP_ID=MMETSP0448-20130528/178977_1 /TAXON_ID=66468 /ORGANISM="Heterocapsa triquestra, Strain CCMP 448" /LENGTH=66 /DNA_ID=CAMNT_0040189229 /DNA_START=84 /DNA_END=280 /DNA_ORIENTATION=+